MIKLYYKWEETKPSAPLLYPKINCFSEKYRNDKKLTDNKFNNNINSINILEIIMKLKLINIIRS